MIRYIIWLFLIGIFLLAGEGVNLIKLGIMSKLADPAATIWPQILLGVILVIGGIGFLGGYAQYRDQKRGRTKKPDWKKQPGS